MCSAHSSRAASRVLAFAALLVGAPAAVALGQNAPASSFTIFLRSIPIGSEQVTVERTPQGWTISSSGRIGAPVDLVLRSLRVRYTADWSPLELLSDTTISGQSATTRTNIEGATARTAVTLFGSTAAERTDPIDPQAILLPNPLVAPYEAMSARLQNAAPGTTFAIHQPGLGSFVADVGASSIERIKTLDRTIAARRTHVAYHLPGAPVLDLEVWGDETGRLLRVSIPAQSLEFAREDIASVAARLVTTQRPNDEDVHIPANGFSLAGTLSKPIDAQGPLPAVVLLGGSIDVDRDETISGVPIFGQMAGALADAGFLVLRYDRRGVGQSGGRPESATLAEYAEDARYAVTALSERKDVDRRRIAVVGYGEGGWIALLAAAKNNRLAAVALVATAAASGTDFNLYQVTHSLERSNRPAAERQQTVDLQRRIQQAVISGKGWDAIELTPAIRRQADTPYFQSFLKFDPAKLMKDVRQPILIVHGALDREVPPSTADQLLAFAQARKGATADAVTVPGINHLLVAATTGETDEYTRLASHTISPAVPQALREWLPRALATPR